MTTIEDVGPIVRQDIDEGEHVVEDTAFRCALALLWARIGLWAIGRAGRTVSSQHNGGMAYKTAKWAWWDRVSQMPWWGFVPTSGRLISPTQAAWVGVAAFLANGCSYIIGLPHVPMDGLLSHHVPQLHVSFSPAAAYRNH